MLIFSICFSAKFLAGQVRKVEESFAESLQKAEALRQSIFKQAFEGKLLTEEEVAKCKADRDYEPASELLERIKAERKK